MPDENEQNTAAPEAIPTLQPPAEVDPGDPVVEAEDNAAADAQTEKDEEQVRLTQQVVDRANEAELDRIAKAQREKALSEKQPPVDNDHVEKDAEKFGQTGDVQQQTAAPVYPSVSVGNKVWIRSPGEPVAMTVAIVTKLHGFGVINVTAFFDGEVPRPLGEVQYGENVPADQLAWFQN